MNNTMQHRGPDDEGFTLISSDKALPLGGNDTDTFSYNLDLEYSPKQKVNQAELQDCFLVLGHRRLSIVDLSPLGHQPMCYADRYWIVYNGEIYNHPELRSELELAGYSFRSHSDTEVILAAYDYWGKDCLNRFNGMWAFVLYDMHDKTLFMARDRFGVKPLYYWIAPDGLLAFASEIKAFTVLPGWNPQVNGQRAYDFLVWNLLDHTNETMFAGVFQLRGGQSALLDVSKNGRESLKSLANQQLPEVSNWYTLKAKPFCGSAADAADQFHDLLEDAVRLQLRADVPVGSCLSGGLDSSSIVCLVNQQLRKQNAHEKQKTFSACASVKRFDEREFVDNVVEHTGVEAHYTYPEFDNLFTFINEITWHQDEPFGSTSIYAQWSVFSLAAKNNVKVMLDGQGADEQLAGYHSYFGALLGGIFKSGRWLELLKELRTIRRLHGYSYSYLAQRFVANLLPFLRLKAAALIGAPAHSAKWLDHELLGAELMDTYAKLATGNSINAISHDQLLATNLPMLLHWEDRDSMAHSIESRVPFLDYRLVEFVLGLPDQHKLSDGITKRVMREAMRDILPEKIRTRMDKLGFVTPEEVWLKETGTTQFEQLMQQAIQLSGGIIKPETMELFHQMVRGERPFNFLIWRIISFGSWLKRFNMPC